jgi:phosphate transport system protein
VTRVPEQPETTGRLRGNGAPGPSSLDRELGHLRRRVLRSANVAIDMLEASLHALWTVDHEVALDVRRRDDAVDDEEVLIERECLRLLTLQRPYAQDFRLITFCLKANADIERVADHATSVAKIALCLDPRQPPQWPTALTEMADRVPVLCHTLLRAVLDEDIAAARSLVVGDRVIDRLDSRLFDEITAWVKREPGTADLALHCYRLGRELERVGDLMANIAEDVVYLVTGEIIRHQTHRVSPPPLAEGA